MSYRLLGRNLRLLATRRAAYVPRLAKPMPYIGVRSLTTSGCKFNEIKKSVSETLQGELKLETAEKVATMSDELQQILDLHKFQVVDTPGANLAELVRKADGETVRVFFDVNQVANLPYAAEEAIEADDEMVDPYSDNFANVNVVVVKDADSTAISFECLADLQNGQFLIENVTPYASAEVALGNTAEAEMTRELVYHGPAFTNLDADLQEKLEEYLRSRAINENLCTFIAGYSEFKENNEYVTWLEKMQKFFK